VASDDTDKVAFIAERLSEGSKIDGLQRLDSTLVSTGIESVKSLPQKAV